MEESWKDIKDYEGIYQISNFGRVRTVNYIDKRGWKRKSKLITPNIDRNNYARVGLTKNYKRIYHQIHRLVAKAFIPNPNELPQVNHKDSNRLNNSVDNLEWVTCSENNLHAWRFGKRRKNYEGTL